MIHFIYYVRFQIAEQVKQKLPKGMNCQEGKEIIILIIRALKVWKSQRSYCSTCLFFPLKSSLMVEYHVVIKPLSLEYAPNSEDDEDFFLADAYMKTVLFVL